MSFYIYRLVKLIILPNTLIHLIRYLSATISYQL